ncbi:Uncharacterised protein [Vibrio cholerae]|nr:Uncharacterised protein [Vibrio cholerae]
MRPTNSKRVTSQESSTPNTRLIGTVSSATTRVNPIAWRVSGSLK